MKSKKNKKRKKYEICIVSNNFYNNTHDVINLRKIEQYSRSLYHPSKSLQKTNIFHIAINDFPSIISSLASKTLFADNFYVFFSCKDPSLPLERTYSSKLWTKLPLATIKWLKLSNSKSTAIHFCKHYKCSRFSHLRLNNSVITTSNIIVIYYLGITYNTSLTWFYHTQDIRRKYLSKINLLKKLVYSRFGSDIQTLLELYCSMI